MLAALVCVPASPTPAVSADVPVRILVIGDSISQGSAGDWTWRYRLWQHLTEHGVAVDFVGPRDDLKDNVTGAFGSHDYVEPAFDREHAARWGMKLGALDVPIASLVSTYQPDVVVEVLGDNDLSEGATPAQVADLLEGFVASARSVDPGIDVVLGRDPRPLLQPQAPAFNELVTDLAEELDSEASPVVVADADAGYNDYQDTWDGAHPNARGELKIAAAVADALSELGVGPPADRPLPAVPLGPRIPPVLSATAGQRGAKLSWVRSPGAETSEVWARDVTAGESDFQLVAPREGVTGTVYPVEGLTPWHTVEFRTRPFKGFWGAAPDALSNVVQVEVLGELDAVETPALSARSGGEVEVSWSAVPNATSYTVQWRRDDRPGDWQSAHVTAALSTIVTGLSSLTTYAFRVQAAHGNMTGPFSSESTVQMPARSDDPANVLLLGDSVTIGSTGDWTWRYRLWKHLAATAPGQVDLVGPRTDLYDRATRTYGHQLYVDPAFDRDHAAGWGTGATFPLHPVHELVVTHEADTVVELLGLNDLDLLPLLPDQVADEVRGIVADARSVNPDVDVVLGEVAQTWVAGAPELNELLHAIASELDTSQARVVVAETADGFFRLRDTYDNSHPNARGEVKIAAAVADALARTGLGAPAARPLASVPVGPRIPVWLRAKIRDGKVKLRWTSSPGADGYRVLVRRPARSEDWKKVGDTSRRRLTIRGLTQGERVQLVVLPRKGRALAELDVRSNRVSLRP